MRNRSSFVPRPLLLLALLTAAACSSSGSDEEQTPAGSSGKAGTAGSAGSAGSGAGQAGSAGSSAGKAGASGAGASGASGAGSGGKAGGGAGGASGAGSGGAGASGASGEGGEGGGGAGGDSGAGGGGEGGGGSGGAPATCGDGEINGDEKCDGDKLGDATCASATGKADAVGDVSCSDKCELDVSKCTFCGDKALNNAEKCDTDQFGDATCASITGKTDAVGTLTCKDTCEIDSSACTFCGDNTLNNSEKCDGDKLGDATCASETGKADAVGTLTCKTDCSIDSSACTYCGDGTRNGAEVCEGADINAATCVSVTGFDDAEGTVACSTTCTFDDSACFSCKDGKTNGAETDQDCGGDKCAKCALDKICKVDSDCESGRCRSGKCGSDIVLAAGTSSIVAGASFLTSADFDGDGKLDVAVVNGAAATPLVTVYKGDGAGKLTLDGATPLSANSGPVAVYSADFDGDKKPDLAVVQQNTSTVRVLKGKGDGTFTLVNDYGTGFAPSDLAVIDYDKDGKLDLAVVTSSDDKVIILKGKGDASFTAAATVPLPASQLEAKHILAGDVNADGSTDLIVSLSALDKLGVLLNDGKGAFKASTVDSPTPNGNPFVAQLAALTKGGPLNVILGNTNGGQMALLEGDGKGAFTAAPTASLTVDGLNQIPIAADFDGDGLPDILVARDAKNLAVVQNNGSYSFQVKPTELPAIAAVVGDFNNDTKPDVAYTTATGVIIALNTTPNP